MLANLRPYTAIKDSGVSWMGGVPTHWHVRRCRYLFRDVDQRSPHGAERHLSMSQRLGLVPSELVEQRTLVSESYAGGKLCEVGDIVLNRLKAHLGVFAVAKYPGVISPDYTVFRPIVPGGAHYFEKTLRCSDCRRELRVRAKGIVEGFWRLYTDDFYDIRLPVPPLEEQLAIVHFLDDADKRIRRYIRAKQKLIALLEEQKLAIIHRVVTRGLDPSVRLKPSGVEWLGDVPEHWAIQSVRRLGRVQGGKALAAGAPGSQRPYLRVANVFDGRILASQTNTMPFTDAEFERYRLKKGDLLLNEGQSLELVGRTARYVGEPPECAFQNSLIRVQAYKHAEPEFLEFLFRHAQHNEIFAAIATQTTNIAHLGVSRLANLVVALPPIAEQRQIVGHLKAIVPEIDAAISRAKRAIDIVREYRARLIADVVTGKLDVREAVASHLPEDGDGDEMLDAGDVAEFEELEFEESAEGEETGA